MSKPTKIGYEYVPKNYRLRLFGVDDSGHSFRIVLVGEERWHEIIKLGKSLEKYLSEESNKTK